MVLRYSCSRCRKSVRLGGIPYFSFKNDWDFGLNLRDLRLPTLGVVERSAICRILNFQTICEIRHERNFEKKFRNHVISLFSTGPQDIAQILPATEQRVFVTFVGEQTKRKAETDASIQAYFSVRADATRAWLYFLKEHNVFYSDIHISEQRIEDLVNERKRILEKATVVNNAISVAASLLAHNEPR